MCRLSVFVKDHASSKFIMDYRVSLGWYGFNKNLIIQRLTDNPRPISFTFGKTNDNVSYNLIYNFASIKWIYCHNELDMYYYKSEKSKKRDR